MDNDLFLLLTEIFELEKERLKSRLSGFETGWEDPNIQTQYNRLVEVARRITFEK